MTHLIVPCCVIRIPFDFQDGRGPVPKRFVVVGHQGNAAIAIKSTSNVGPFLDRRSGLHGVAVFFEGEFDFFNENTIIDPMNCFAIPHANLAKLHQQSRLEHLGSAQNCEIES